MLDPRRSIWLRVCVRAGVNIKRSDIEIIVSSILACSAGFRMQVLT